MMKIASAGIDCRLTMGTVLVTNLSESMSWNEFDDGNRVNWDGLRAHAADRPGHEIKIQALIIGERHSHIS